MRQVYLADILKKKGFSVTGYALCRKKRDIRTAFSLKESLENANMIVAPVPFLKAGKIFGSNDFSDLTMENILKYAGKDVCFWAGGIPDTFIKSAEKVRIKCIDYLKDDYTVIQNTVAAAEGMLAEAITRSPKNLWKSTCLVIGYGNCGSTLVSFLKKFSCCVIVCEKEEKALAKAFVYADRAIPFSELVQNLNEVSYIFNTAPVLVLTKTSLQYVRKDALILDLASMPGGVDYEAAREMGIQAVLLPGLPGKYAPESSAEILVQTIFRKIRDPIY